MMEEIEIKLSRQQVDIILAGLAELPLKVSAETYSHVQAVAIATFTPQMGAKVGQQK